MTSITPLTSPQLGKWWRSWSLPFHLAYMAENGQQAKTTKHTCIIPIEELNQTQFPTPSAWLLLNGLRGRCMNYQLDIIPTYSEAGNVITVIISSPTEDPIRQEELIDALREYALYLEGIEEEARN